MIWIFAKSARLTKLPTLRAISATSAPQVKRWRTEWTNEVIPCPNLDYVLHNRKRDLPTSHQEEGKEMIVVLLAAAAALGGVCLTLQIDPIQERESE